ncbi:MAG: hypothetical protein ABR587_07105 [Candidatus Binatia bacterium]
MLGKTSMRILKHAIAVMRPRGGVFDVDVDEDVCRSMVGFLEYLPAPTRLSFPLGLRLLEYGPFLFREGFRTFSSMDGETAARYLHHWERAGSAPSLLYQGVRALVFVCFYQHPKILEAMEVDWQGRADERVRFRARIMREQILRDATGGGSAVPASRLAARREPSALAPAETRDESSAPALAESPDETTGEEGARTPAPKRRSRKKAAVVAADDAAQTPAEVKTPAGGAS